MELIRDGVVSWLEIMVNLSLQGSFCIALVFVARFLLSKAPRWCSYVLWGMVFLRLICPVFPEGRFSLMPRQLQIDREYVLEQMQTEHTVVEEVFATEDVVVMQDETESVLGNALPVQDSMSVDDSKDVMLSDIVSSKLPDTENVVSRDDSLGKQLESIYVDESSDLTSMEDTMQSKLSVSGMNSMVQWAMGIALVWLLGASAFATYHVVSYQMLKRRVRTAIEMEEGVYELIGEHLSFVMGIINPKIYLSAGLDAETKKVILCHERVHLQRKDYIWKPLALGICCLHWWNPLVWLAFYLMNKDCEMSCDEKVVALLGEESKTVYSYALLNEATKGEWSRNRRGSVCALLSFGEDHVKNRITHVLKYRKASIGVICCAVLVIIVLGVGLCSNPKAKEVGEELTNLTAKEQEALITQQAKELQEQMEALNNAKKAEASKAEQEALQDMLEQVEKEQQEIEQLKKEEAQDNAEEYDQMALALEKYIWAFAGRDGNALFELAKDKDAFLKWDMVYPQTDGTFAFGESSPWVRDWTTLLRKDDQSIATIRFIMESSIPEYYIAEETVKLTPAENGYFVDHVDYKLYSEINSVQEMEKVYQWTNGTAVKGIPYNVNYVTSILEHLAKETNPSYYSAYQDPIRAAKVLLHLGDGIEEKHEYEVLNAIYPPESTAYAVGTTVMVSYVFADGSTAQIPMILAEELEGIWMLAENDDVLDDTEQEAMEQVSNICKLYDSCEVGEVTYRMTNMGIYRVDESGMKLIYSPVHVGVDTKLAYYNGKLYFPTDKSYTQGALDWMDNSICVYDIETGMVDYIDLPQTAWDMFPLADLYVEDGFITLWRQDGLGCYCMLLQDVHPVYNGKYATQLDAKEIQAYGSAISRQILDNPNRIHCFSNHTKNSTFAYLDLDGDGTIEEVTMTKYGNGYDGPMDSFILSVGEWSEECHGMNQVNEIYAWSPDGEQILILLYEDGPSGDPLTTFYRYEDDKLRKIGTIASDVRDDAIDDGIISTVIRQDVIQTDGIKVQYCINENGEVELIEQETYDFVALNNIELKEVLKLYAEPNGSLENRVVMKAQTVHITKTDQNFEWVLVEGIDGTKGWLRVRDVLYVGDDEVVSGVIFDGLSFAG